MIAHRYLLFAIFLLSFHTGFAQVGVTGSYRSNLFTSHWKLFDQIGSDDIELIGNGPSIGLDYWFRLKKKRVEFMPELNYARFENEPMVNLNTELTQYSFFFNVHFYPYDFGSDCDCPTFSKNGRTLEKGFFVRLSPGVSYIEQELSIPERVTSTEAIAFNIALGVGLDFGVADLLTISPLVEMRYFPSVNWEGLETVNENNSSFVLAGETSNIWQFMAGIRLGLRLDYR